MNDPAPSLPPPPPSSPLNWAPFRFFRFVKSHHAFGALFIVAFATVAISVQVGDRTQFADSELSQDVESRWGAPVVQPAPSLRYVQSGSIFTELKPLHFEKQHVHVDAAMNYRKRGLRYFSGFDFALTAQYAVANREAHDIDVAFIFPIEVDKSQVLLSELSFKVDGQDSSLDLGEAGNRLVWTGRIEKGKTAEFFIRYRARGLESFLYRLDPSLPAKDVKLHVGVQGGENFDYPPQVLSATSVSQSSNAVSLDWAFPSLESGVALGVVLPSEKTYDQMISAMASRAWVPFTAFLALLAVLSLRHRRPLAFYETYLLAAAFGFSFVLLAYLAAFMNFYVAYAISMLGMGAATLLYLSHAFPEEKRWVFGALWTAVMLVPTAAVILEGYTGLIYTLELLAALLGLMAASTAKGTRAFFSDLRSPPSPTSSPDPKVA